MLFSGLQSNCAPDITDIGQLLIEDNIVAVSRQMIDKEASAPAKGSNAGRSNGQTNGEMEIDEEL
jgi:26S proteasome regulatory subunit N11